MYTFCNEWYECFPECVATFGKSIVTMQCGPGGVALICQSIYNL